MREGWWVGLVLMCVKRIYFPTKLFSGVAFFVSAHLKSA